MEICKLLASIFEQSFIGKSARVNFSNVSGALGTGMEHSVEIQMHGGFELKFLTLKNDFYFVKEMKEKYNSFINEHSERVREKSEIEVSQYKYRDSLRELFNEFVSQQQIMIGRFFLTSVTRFEVDYRELNKVKHVYAIKLYTKDGAYTEITLDSDNFKNL